MSQLCSCNMNIYFKLCFKLQTGFQSRLSNKIHKQAQLKLCPQNPCKLHLSTIDMVFQETVKLFLKFIWNDFWHFGFLSLI